MKNGGSANGAETALDPITAQRPPGTWRQA